MRIEDIFYALHKIVRDANAQNFFLCAHTYENYSLQLMNGGVLINFEGQAKIRLFEARDPLPAIKYEWEACDIWVRDIAADQPTARHLFDQLVDQLLV